MIYETGKVYKRSTNELPYITVYNEACFDKCNKITKLIDQKWILIENKDLVFTIVDLKPSHNEQFLFLKILYNAKKYCLIVADNNTAFELVC